MLYTYGLNECNPSYCCKNNSLIFVPSYHVLVSLATKIIISWEVTLRSWADRCACFAVKCCPSLQERTEILCTFCEWRFYQNTGGGFPFYKAIMSTATAVKTWTLTYFYSHLYCYFCSGRENFSQQGVPSVLGFEWFSLRWSLGSYFINIWGSKRCPWLNSLSDCGYRSFTYIKSVTVLETSGQ